VIGFYLLGPLGLLVSGLCWWSLYNAWRHERVRSHGWIYRSAEPRFFWFLVVFTLFAAVWFALIGIVVFAYILGFLDAASLR